MLFFWNCVRRLCTSSELLSGDAGKVVDVVVSASMDLGFIDLSTDSFGYVRRVVPSVLNFPSIL